MTRQFLRSEQRNTYFIELNTNDDADYAEVVDINLSLLKPMTAKPHSHDNISAVRNMKNIAVAQVCLGSCTNFLYKYLVIAAKILKCKVVHADGSFILAPGSR